MILESCKTISYRTMERKATCDRRKVLPVLDFFSSVSPEVAPWTSFCGTVKENHPKQKCRNVLLVFKTISISDISSCYGGAKGHADGLHNMTLQSGADEACPCQQVTQSTEALFVAFKKQKSHCVIRCKFLNPTLHFHHHHTLLFNHLLHLNLHLFIYIKKWQKRKILMHSLIHVETVSKVLFTAKKSATSIYWMHRHTKKNLSGFMKRNVISFSKRTFVVKKN